MFISMMLSVLFQPADWGDLPAVLVWLFAGGGGTAVLAWAISYLAEHWPGWHALPAVVKFIVPILVSFGLSVAANYALNYTELLDQIQPYWLMLVTAVAGWIATQSGHETAKIRGVSARAKARLR